jgi:hypothetical protein
MRHVMLDRPRTTSTTIKIVTMGTGITQYVGEQPLTLDRLLEELRIDGHVDVRVNGTPVERTYRLLNGDQVLILPRIRGGSR